MKAALHRIAHQVPGWVIASLTCVALTAPSGSPALAADEPDPWIELQALKERLAGEIVSADFVQTFLPAGFSSGDEETGVLHLSIPDCLRWDYREPYPKTYLVCGQEAYTWNEGEPQGRRLVLESDAEPGLDFLRLRVETLKLRYSARSETLDTNLLRIVFTPLDPRHSLVHASVDLDMTTHLLRNVTYEDLEGNRSRFDISNYRPTSGSTPFDLPSNIEWLE